MRANQAAIQRRVNNPPRTIPPPGYGASTSSSSSSNQSQNQSASNSYAPYPSPQQNQQPQYPSQQQSNIQTPSQSSAGKMPSGLNPQQQLQFILNVLGERIAKLEMNVSELSSYDFSTGSSTNSSSSINPAVLQKEIANHPEIASIKDFISKLQAPQSFSGPSPNVIDDIQTNIESIFEQLDNSDVTRIQEELQTRTELLVSEINQVKDMVLQLQNTVINVLLPAIIAQTPPAVPVSTLETFTQAPLNIIQEDPFVSAATLEKNLEIAELPTITEPLTYQES